MNATASRPRLLAALLAWLNRRMAPPGVRITRDTLLFEGGMINSIRILELIAWTERAIERRIDDVDIQMSNFRTPARIAAVFGTGDRDDQP
ncbi:MAG TPA: hypothetical protein VF722_04360 [Gemmatimonadaceae bacterium]|jgi:acyl carrier protein